MVYRFCSSNTRLSSILNCEFHSCQNAYLTGQNASAFSLTPQTLHSSSAPYQRLLFLQEVHLIALLAFLSSSVPPLAPQCLSGLSLAPQCLPLSSRIPFLKWSWPSTNNLPKLSSRLQGQNTTSSNPTSSDPAWPSGSLLLSWDVLPTLPSRRVSTRNYCCHVPELSHLRSKEELELPLQLPLAWVNSGFRHEL